MTWIDIAVAGTGERMLETRGLDEIVVTGARQGQHEAVVERGSREDRVAPHRRPDRASRLGLDQRIGVRRAVSDGATGQLAEQQWLVEEPPVGVENRHFLERDDIGLKLGHEGRDLGEPFLADVPPPARRERLARPDPCPDVPADDTQPAGPGGPAGGHRDVSALERYLTEPASRPWTKYRWRLKKTASGTTIRMNAEAARRCHSVPYVPRSVVTWTVIG